MWVEGRDAYAGSLKTPPLERLVCEGDLCQHVFLGHVVASDSQRSVGGQMDGAKLSSHEHRRDVLGAGLALDNLHMPDIFVAGQRASLFVDGRGCDGLDLA